jgi:NitT/TauT family transport system substrate-binding protein
VRGVPYQIIAPGPIFASNRPDNLLVVRKDGPIRTAADLNGKTIVSSALGDLADTSALGWIDQHGGNASTVKSVELRPASTLAVLLSGRVDAAVIGEPFLSDALHGGAVRVLGNVYETIGPRFLESAYIAMPDFIEANPELVKRYARAQLDGNAFANAHPDQTAPWLADMTKMDLAKVKQTQRFMFAESMDSALVQTVIDALVRLKQIDRGFDARELISPLTLGMKRS